MNKRVLICTVQPPPTCGVQAIRYGKLLEPLKKQGWDLHFLGPHPKLMSVLPLTPFDPGPRGHYIEEMPLVNRAAVRRRQTRGLRRLYWFTLQAMAKIGESIGLGSDYETQVQTAMKNKGSAILTESKYDLVAGIQPAFFALRVGKELSQSFELPFLAIYDDPYGARTLEGFIPAEPEEQSDVINSASRIVFASSLTRENYINSFPFCANKSHGISDCFTSINCEKNRTTENDIKLTHLGDIGPWRPIDTLVDALLGLNCKIGRQVTFSQFGYLYPSAKKLIRKDKKLRKIFNIFQGVSYLKSHQIARSSDILVVIVGPRHFDNVPSKLFEYLSAHKPILLLSPPNNPSRKVIQSLGVGLWCNVNSVHDIQTKLEKLISTKDHYQDAYVKNRQELYRYEVNEVAKRWANIFNQAIESQT